MIITSSKPKKRFNIETKVNAYLQNKFSLSKTYKKGNETLSYLLSEDYDVEITNAKDKLALLENELEQIEENESKEFKEKKETLRKKVQLIKDYLENLERSQKRSSNVKAVKIQNVKYSAKTIRMGSIYRIVKKWQKYLITALIGSLASLIVWLFVQYTGVYSPGISGIIQGFAKIINIVLIHDKLYETATIVYNILFWGLYFVINIPLLIFAYFKINKDFALLTIIYIAFAQLVGLGLGFINNGKGIFIFANMSAEKIQATTNLYIDNVQMIPWNAGAGIIPSLFVYAVAYALVFGISNSILYILGSSTGGTDVFGFYYSKVKNKSIGTMLTYFNVGSLIIGVILGSFICWLISSNSTQRNPDTILEAFFSPNLISSILAAIITGVIYNYFFPKNKIVKVQIYSNKAQEVAFHLIKKDWHYKLIVSQNKVDSLKMAGSSKSLETVCLYLNLPELISNIREVDKEGLVTIYSTSGVDGELPTTTYEK